MPVVSVHPELLLALDREWRGAREIHARLGMWAQTSVRHMLHRMKDENLIEAKQVRLTNGNDQWLFRAKERTA